MDSPLDHVGASASEAQKVAHSKADPQGVNAKHKPDQYGNYLEWGWDVVLPQLAPSKGNKNKLKSLVDGAYEKAEKENIPMNKALAAKANEMGFQTPSQGPPPPVPGEAAPAKGEAGNGDKRGGLTSKQRSEMLTKANQYIRNGMDRSKAFKTARHEVKPKFQSGDMVIYNSEKWKVISPGGIPKQRKEPRYSIRNSETGEKKIAFESKLERI